MILMSGIQGFLKFITGFIFLPAEGFSAAGEKIPARKDKKGGFLGKR
jgi:hypothetical protein